MGDRVCIDCISMLREDEGCLLGSSSKLMALVHGETLPGKYVPARPFRINSGPIHSYIMMADGSTKYLSEVVAGDIVKVVSLGDQGQLLHRGVTVGRCKIEPRPMLLIEFLDVRESTRGQIFLQQAETVRLVSTNHGVATSVTDLKVGDKICVVSNMLGTHVGRRIVGNVNEK